MSNTIEQRAEAYADKAWRAPKQGSIAANAYIAGATEERALMEPTIERIKKMQVKYDENGYDLPPEIQLQRIEQHIDGAFSIWQNRCASLEERVKELEGALIFIGKDHLLPVHLIRYIEQALNPKQQ